MKKEKALIVSFSGLLLAYLVFYGLSSALGPSLYPDPGLRDKEYDPGAYVTLSSYSDGDWEMGEIDGKTAYISPQIEDVIAKVALYEGEERPQIEVLGYIDGEVVQRGSLALEDERYMYRFPFSYTYIDQVAFLTEAPLEGTYDLEVGKVVKA